MDMKRILFTLMIIVAGFGTAMAQCTITPTNGKDRTLCVNTTMSPNIIYITTEATGATVTGLPNGITGNWSSNTVTISGTPSSSGTFPYTVTLTGECNTVTETGTITVSPLPTITNTTPAARCGTGTLTLSATASSGATVRWWSASIGGTQLGTGSPWTTPSISTTTTYYAEAYNSTTDCISSSRTSVTATVNVIPTLSSVTSKSICSGMSVAYTSTSATSGTTFSWTRAAVTGITPSTGSGSGASITEVLTNSTTYPINVTYVITLTANSCSNTQNVTVTVNPKPTLSSATSKSMCSGMSVDYTATSATSGTTFSWTRAAVTGITPSTGSGSGASITEVLTNSTANPIDVTYIITLTANSCSNTQNVAVTVNPTPTLSSAISIPAICSGHAVNYTATSATQGTTFNWTRKEVPGILPPTSFGSESSINEVLTNSKQTSLEVIYAIAMTANTCPNTQEVTVVVYGNFKIEEHPTNASICKGTAPSFPLKVEASGGNTPYTFIWYKSMDKHNWDSVGSGNTYQPSALDSTTYYCCEVISANGCGTQKSDIAEILVTDLLTVDTLSPGQTICYDFCPETLFFKVTEAPARKWRWEQSSNGIEWEFAKGGSGSDEEKYLPPQLREHIYYRCIVTSPGCIDKPDTITSDPILINVLDKFELTTISKDTTICENTIPNPIEVVAIGGKTPYDYQWQQSETGASGSWTPISGAINSSYQPPSLSKTINYRCIVKSDCGEIQSDTVRIIRITVTSGPSNLNTIITKNDIDKNPYMLIYPNPESKFVYQWYENNKEIWYIRDGDTIYATEQFYYPPNYGQDSLYIGYEYTVYVSYEKRSCGNFTKPYIHTAKAPSESKVFTLSPNPAPNGYFTISFNPDVLQNKTENYLLNIYSLIGEKIWEQKVITLEDVVITKNIPAGLYLVTLNTGNHIYSEKIIVQ